MEQTNHESTEAEEDKLLGPIAKSILRDFQQQQQQQDDTTHFNTDHLTPPTTTIDDAEDDDFHDDLYGRDVLQGCRRIVYLLYYVQPLGDH